MTGTADPAARGADAVYRELRQRVVDELSGQLPPGPALPVMIPTVGFGGQSRAVLTHTVRELARQRAAVPISVVLLVNRPEARPADSTPFRARGLAAARNSTAVQFAVAELTLPRRPRMGELRQLLLEAVLQVQGLDPDRTACVVCDDDIVRAPAGMLADLHRVVSEPGVAAALGPVLFDSEHSPAPLWPAFFAADALRALLAAKFVRRLRQEPFDAARHAEFDHHAEAIALSGNFAARASAIQQAGGFAPLNEITNLTRGIHHLGPGTIAGTWDFDPGREDVLIELRRRALHTSARRAMAAYLATGTPSVGQWRVWRFRSSRVDPVRTMDAPAGTPVRIADLDNRRTAELVTELNSVLTTTLRYFPTDLEVIEDCLAALGLSTRSLSLGVGSAAPTVTIREAAGLLDRLAAAQRDVDQSRTPRETG
ncbi:hypothetical protein A4G26_07655 [Mycobacterium kansasii]|uniref:Uncharacterized protein n=1 Tax=Mycobacterium innocens TaxID=2341083 RepID=A0A498Q5X7_9MYCO|nr:MULTISPECIES: hypothetical protein [Mycobacterium]KZS69063.1 hypothetical protein A4G26_07655 [Mycobacterium kansasii]VBA40701.1 hypothetical protein LAUMK13_03190 [Mycobacterium innocens]